MRILLVFFGSDYHGGSAYSTFTIAKELVARGHEVHAYARATSSGVLLKDLEAAGVKVHAGRSAILVHPRSKQKPLMRAVRLGLELGRRFYTYPKSERDIERIIRTYDIELVAISSGAIATGARAAQRAGVPYVWHAREFMQEDHNLDYYPWAPVYELMGGARSLICVSRAVEKKMRDVCPQTHTDVVYNGIDQTVFNPTGRMPREDGQPVRVMFSGGLRRSKGAFLLLDALSMMGGAQPYTLDVFGAEGTVEEESAKAFLARVAELGLTDIVRYHGLVKNIVDQYRTHDIAVVASRAEAFGRVTAEAMLCGCAVVGSNSGGTPELIADGRGYLFAPEDAQSLAEALQTALEDEEERLLRAQTALSYACEHFSVKAYVDGIEAAYQAAVA